MCCQYAIWRIYYALENMTLRKKDIPLQGVLQQIICHTLKLKTFLQDIGDLFHLFKRFVSEMSENYYSKQHMNHVT